MRQLLNRQLTKELEQHVGPKPVEKADAFPVSTYRQLVEQVAKLSYANMECLLFYRGQGIDFRNKAEASTFYPPIYRGDYLPQRELNDRFRLLEDASRQLRELFTSEAVEGADELRWKVHIQWSILQHYQVCATPLIDLTHSLRVACSFAQLDAKGAEGFVYVFGFPYVMNRISHNSEHDIVNVRLLSICPPEALRPYFQEAYLAATEDITNEYDDKSDLDFNRRLIAKFSIPAAHTFWGRGFGPLPESVLYPKGDRIAKLCSAIEVTIKRGLLPGELGTFIQLWADLDSALLEMAARPNARLLSTREAIEQLSRKGLIDRELSYSLHELRKFRNKIVHDPKKIPFDEIDDRTEQVRRAIAQLRQDA